MIVEDEALISLVIQEMSGYLGWQLAGSARNETAALLLLETIQPSVAVIEIYLNRSTGFQVAAACRARGIPVLFISDFRTEIAPAECGDDLILAKPFSIDDFERALNSAFP